MVLEPVAAVEEVATKTDGTPIFNGTGKVAPGDRLYSEAQVEAMRRDFCAAIEHALGEGLEAATFLKCWNEGDWEGCREFGFTPSQHLTDPTATPQ